MAAADQVDGALQMALYIFARGGRADGGTIGNLAESLTVEARTADGRLFQLPVEFAGAPGGRMPGLDQIKVLLHPELRGAGLVDLTIIINGQRSNTAAINVR